MCLRQLWDQRELSFSIVLSGFEWPIKTRIIFGKSFVLIFLNVKCFWNNFFHYLESKRRKKIQTRNAILKLSKFLKDAKFTSWETINFFFYFFWAFKKSPYFFFWASNFLLIYKNNLQSKKKNIFFLFYFSSTLISKTSSVTSFR